MSNNFLYGPIFSRRLGFSLGVDIIPHKTCSFDCIYCECGKTDVLTLERKIYSPTGKIIQELDNFLKEETPLDYITFSGSGEPTLHSEIGKIIAHIKNNYPHHKTAVLTNSSLLKESQVVKDILEADLIVASLDAVSDEKFKLVNRPHANLQAQDICFGIEKLSREHSNVNIEILFVSGVNDTKEELTLFKDYLSSLNFEMLQINTVSRPAAEKWAKALSAKELKEIVNYLNFKNIVVTS